MSGGYRRLARAYGYGPWRRWFGSGFNLRGPPGVLDRGRLRIADAVQFTKTVEPSRRYPDDAPPYPGEHVSFARGQFVCSALNISVISVGDGISYSGRNPHVSKISPAQADAPIGGPVGY